ncbi:MAG: fibronectin type III domain-containing protein [Candidatus Cloacimonetes bacterium]|nr:fibronectin type III domain-containing protein [Candidatus Cloacimonadota bacterium]
MNYLKSIFLFTVCVYCLSSCDITDPKLGHNPPKNLVGTAGIEEAALSWEKPKNPNLYFSGYHIYMNGTKIEPKITNVTNKKITHTVRGITAGVKVFYIRAEYELGLESEPSNTITVIVLPAL